MNSGRADAIVFAALGLALAGYYFAEALPWEGPLWLGGLGVFWLLCLYRPDLGALWPIAVVALYRFPKTLTGLPVGSPSLSLFEVAVLAAFAAWVLRTLVASGVSGLVAQLRRLGLLPTLLLVAATLSSLASDYPRYAWREYRTVIVEPLLLYLMLQATLESSGRQWWRALNVFVLSGAVIAVASLWHYVFVGVVEATGGVRRVLAVFHSPNELALYLGRIAPPAVVLAASRSMAGGWRWLYALAAAPMLAVLYLTYSRGAWLGVIAALALVALLRWGRRAALPIGLGVVAMGIVVAVVPQGRLVGEASSAQRVYLWRSAAAMIEDHPLLGVGPDGFLYHYPQYMRPEAWAEPDMAHPHNILLDFWLRTGILGVATMTWLQASFWRRVLPAAVGGAGTRRRAALALAASMADMLAHGLVDNGFFLVYLAVSFWLVYALSGRLADLPAAAALPPRDGAR